MPITHNEALAQFHLTTPNTSYVIKVIEETVPVLLYYGARVDDEDLSYLPYRHDMPFSPKVHPGISYNGLPVEYPFNGTSDYRTPAYSVISDKGHHISEITYRGYTVEKGKARIPQLPASYACGDECETLTLQMYDEVLGLNVFLSYHVFTTCDVITRRATFVNGGNAPITLTKVASASLSLQHSNFEVITLHGAWGRERFMERRPVAHGNTTVSSTRGSSSHHQHPFMALVSSNTTEDYGEVYAMTLVYSGNHLAEAEVCEGNRTRMVMGINPFHFAWHLDTGETFHTPEAVLTYSAAGLTPMSRAFHTFTKKHVLRGKFKDGNRPILVNSWEAMYFDISIPRVMALAEEAKSLGIDLFVLDDGWFGKRDDDRTSLGDWVTDRAKLPNGVDALAKDVVAKGIQFGLWFEPEAISEESDLYRAHPDWCLHVPERRRTQGRNELLLDFSRDDVCDAIIEMLSKVLSSAPITYVKWDMNRNMSEVGSALLPAKRQGEVAHRYMLGLYRVMEKLTTSFPDVLFEGCSGGGGRFDLGILHYMPQFWTSDDTDPVFRLFIQWGTSIIYPAITMTAHVAECPSHQSGRTTPQAFRAAVAMMANFGYELELTKLSDEEKAEVRDEIAFYKRIRHIVFEGDMYRLSSPYESNSPSVMFVTRDKREAVVFEYHVAAEIVTPHPALRLKGLDRDARYRSDERDITLTGKTLMNAGLPRGIVGNKDYQQMITILKRVDA